MEKEENKKLELLKREEIKTMAKDIARLREEEAKKEREKIVTLKTEEEAKIEKEKLERKKLMEELKKEGELKEEVRVILPRKEKIQLEEKIEKPTTKILTVVKHPSPFEKIFIRAVLIVIFLLFLTLIFTFWYWYSNEMRLISLLPSLSPTPTPIEEITPTPSITPTPTPVSSPTFSIIDRFVTWGFYIPRTPRLIDTIIIHSTYNTLEGDFYDPEKVVEGYKISKVTPHYLITRDGMIFRLAPDEAIAYHAGTGKMPDGTRKNIINNFSIGIELIYTKEDSPTEIQYQALAYLIKNLQQKYNIPSQNILGHKDINPNKGDPWNFDWEKFNKLLK